MMITGERLTITQELEALLADYWHEVDTNWGRRAADYYTEDAIFEGSEYTYRGRAKINEFYQYRINRGARIAVHAITNFRVVPESSRSAISTWYLLLYANDGVPVMPTAPPIQIALMTDHCVRDPGGAWRYRHRKFGALFKGGVPTTSPNLG